MAEAQLAAIAEPLPADSVPIGPWRLLWRRLRVNRVALAGLSVIVLLIAIAAAAPLIAPYSYDGQYRGAEHQPPGWTGSTRMTEESESQLRRFPLGTDMNARDVLTRVIYGARVSLAVGVLATALSLLAGVTIGLLSGFYGGWIDAVLMRFTDTVYAFPSVLLAVAITAVFDKPSLWVVFVALGLVGWTSMARLVRSQVLSVKTLDYVAAARALGVGNLRIVFRHVLPNCFGPIVVVATLGVGGNILGEAGLSFLGLGVQEPYPSWGAMLAGARQHYQDYWWLGVFPGLAIVMTVLAFNLFGDGLRDALDPRKSKM